MDNLFFTMKTTFNKNSQSIAISTVQTLAYKFNFNTVEKASVFGVILVRIFPTGKMRTRITERCRKNADQNNSECEHDYAVQLKWTGSWITSRKTLKYFVKCVRRLIPCLMSLIALLWLHVCPPHLLTLPCISLIREFQMSIYAR